MTFVIDVQLGALGPSDPSPSVDCVRIAKPGRNEQWDATPRRIQESRDGVSTHVRATASDGPHWQAAEIVDVTIWLTMTSRSGRHVLTLSGQQICP